MSPRCAYICSPDPAVAVPAPSGGALQWLANRFAPTPALAPASRPPLYIALLLLTRHSGHSKHGSMVAWIPLFTLPERLHTPGRTPPRRPTTHISTMPAIVLSFSLGHRWIWPLEPLATLPERHLQYTHHSEHRLAVPQLPSASRATEHSSHSVTLCCTAASVCFRNLPGMWATSTFPGHIPGWSSAHSCGASPSLDGVTHTPVRALSQTVPPPITPVLTEHGCHAVWSRNRSRHGAASLGVEHRCQGEAGFGIEHRCHGAAGVGIEHRRHGAAGVGIEYRRHGAAGVGVEHRRHGSADVGIEHWWCHLRAAGDYRCGVHPAAELDPALFGWTPTPTTVAVGNGAFSAPDDCWRATSAAAFCASA